MRSLSLALAAVTTLALLAGCSGGAKLDERPADGLVATKETGILRGVVVDAAIVPVAGVQVRLTGPTGNTTDLESDATGSFGAGGLPPGAYAVAAAKPGYFPATATAIVVAGEAAPEVVKVTLLADEATRPYAEQLVFSGYMECAVTAGVGFGACGFLNDETTGAGLGNLTADNVQVRYNLTRVPSFVQSEMVWQSTQQLGTSLALMYSYGDCGEGFYCDFEVAGGSPLILTAKAEDIETIGLGKTEDLYIRVFNEGGAESAGLGGATIQQRFEIYTTVFYGYEPPEGWTFIADHQVPPSQ